ncbi:MAG: tetratricopeptide repeat protein [Planctomycetota bacterium]
MKPPVTRLRLQVGITLAIAWFGASSPLLLRADEADDRYAVAAGHYAQGRWRFAADEFERFVEEHPEHPKVSRGIFFLAEALVQLQRLDDAAVHFREYLEREPQGPFARQASFRAAEAAYLAGRFDAAKAELGQFLDAYPNDELNAYVLPYLGNVLLSQDDVASAEKCFRDGLEEFPHGRMQDECRFGLARALERQAKTDQAERLYTALAAKTVGPLADDAQFFLGAVQYAAGRFEEALRTFDPFESRLAASPWQSTARLGRAWALLKLDRPVEAKPFLVAVSTDAKVGVEARYWLGLTHKALEKWSTAAEELLKTAADHPEHKLVPAIRFHAGDALIRSGDAAAAAEQFDWVIASAPPDNPWIDDALRGRIQAALAQKDHATTDRTAEELTRRFPQSPVAADVRRMLGHSLVEREQYRRAADVLEPLVSGEEEGVELLDARYLLALAYEGLKRYDDALEVLAPVVDSAAGELRADARLAQASVLMKLDRFEDAITPLEALRATDSMSDKTARAFGNLAICYAQTGRFDDAKALCDLLVETHPNSPLIAPTTEQLAELAYRGGQTEWSRRLFARLAGDAPAAEPKLRGISGLAWSQFRLGQREAAEATFDRLLEEAPDSPLAAEAALVRGRILEELGRPDPALAMYHLVVDRHANTEQFPQALWSAALLHDSLQQDEEAVALYRRLAEGHPGFPQIDAVLYNWAWAAHDTENGNEFRELLNRLRKEHPESSYWADATYRLAQDAFQKQAYDQARTLANEALAAEPSPEIRESLLYLTGQIAAADERWDEARRSCEALLADYPESPLRLTAQYVVAESVFRGRDYATAAEQFGRLLEASQNRDQPWLAIIPLRLAQALCHQKRWDEAHRIASTIRAEHVEFPEQYEADYVIGRCLSNRAEFQAAREAYRRVIHSPEGAKTETAAKAQLMIAESYFHQENYEAALREYLALEILYDFPAWQAAAVFQAAKCHEMLGEWQQAVDQYDRLVHTYPRETFVEEAAERLEAVKRRLEASTGS